jgi:hypothetical protein
MIKLLPTFDRGNKPTWSCAASCPRFASGTTIFWRDFFAFQRALTSPAASSSFAAKHRNLFLKHLPAFKQCRFDPLSKVHERLDIHLGQICLCHSSLGMPLSSNLQDQTRDILASREYIK